MNKKKLPGVRGCLKRNDMPAQQISSIWSNLAKKVIRNPSNLDDQWSTFAFIALIWEKVVRMYHLNIFLLWKCSRPTQVSSICDKGWASFKMFPWRTISPEATVCRCYKAQSSVRPLRLLKLVLWSIAWPVLVVYAVVETIRVKNAPHASHFDMGSPIESNDTQEWLETLNQITSIDALFIY